MPELDDQQLLGEFVGRNSGAAFTALVARYVHLVYSTGLRFSGNPQRAEVITQVAIIILASDFPGGRSATVQSAQFRSLSPDFSRAYRGLVNLLKLLLHQPVNKE